MPATLSPFRYIQVARYLMQWWLDNAPGLAARRKAAQQRAADFLYAPRMRGRAMAAAAATAQVSEDENESARARRAAQNLPVDVVDMPPTYHDDPSVLLPRPDAYPDNRFPAENTEIYRLMNDERAFIEGQMKAPKEIIVLCHGELERCRPRRRHGRAVELQPRNHVGPSLTLTPPTGLYGFSTATPIPLFPSLKLHYWASVLEVLRDRLGAKVVVVGVKGCVGISTFSASTCSCLVSWMLTGSQNWIDPRTCGTDAQIPQELPSQGCRRQLCRP